jgi:hypothetical protein
MNDDELRAEFLRILRYEPATGRLLWKSGMGNMAKANREAGSVHQQGHRRVMFRGKSYYTHRIIFLLHQGHLPEQIDHIDHDPTNNRLENLRAATNKENGRNRSAGKNNTSGMVGVGWNKKDRRWIARIKINGQLKYLGSYSEKSDAIEVRRQANIDHGFHANHGMKTKVPPTQDK